MSVYHLGESLGRSPRFDDRVAFRTRHLGLDMVTIERTNRRRAGGPPPTRGGPSTAAGLPNAYGVPECVRACAVAALYSGYVGLCRALAVRARMRTLTLTHTHAHTHTHTHTQQDARTHQWPRTHMHTLAHTRARTHARTHTRARARPRAPVRPPSRPPPQARSQARDRRTHTMLTAHYTDRTLY